MSLSAYPAVPKEIKELELRSLELMKANRILSSFSPTIQSDAQTSYSRLKGLTRYEAGTTLYSFESFLDLEIEKHLCRVYFGGKVTLFSSSKCDTVSYHIAICEKDTKAILRKFHFDFDSGGDGRSRSKKPFYHLQYGGEITPLMISDGVPKAEEKVLNHWLSLPRISYMPMSLISIIALIFREFNPEKALELFGDNHWKAHLRRCEKQMHKDFHRVCGQKLSHNESLIFDCFYH